MSLNKILIFVLFLSVPIQCLKLSSIEKTYQKGFEAYSGERWSECIAQFEDSIHLYKLYKAAITNCRQNCDNEQHETKITDNMEDLKMYENFFVKKDCLLKCHQTSFEDMHLLNELFDSVLSDMENRKPYSYLHICYFQMNALPKAASSAYTYLITNPNDEQMMNNLKYYIQQPEADAKDLVDYLSEKYKLMYKSGLKSYKENNWSETITYMEAVLSEYLSSENICRSECERQPEQEWNAEYVITVSNYMAALLHCQQLCQDRLKILNYNSGIEFLADILNYLQISYYHLSKYDNAAEAVSTYLMISPKDEDMLINKNIYSSIVDPKAFTERSDIFYYFKRDKSEKMLLNLFHQGSKETSNNI